MPKHPWSKGKVENPFDYLEDHFIKERSFDSFEHLVDKLAEFQDRVNHKEHSTTQHKPADLLQVEKQHLLDLPAARYVGIEEDLRKVSADCLISYNGSKYSVPHYFVGKQVWVRISQGSYIQIHASTGNLIAQHNLSLHKGKVIMIDEHYKNHQVERGNWQRLVNTFAQLFPDHLDFTDHLYTQKRINPNYHLARILDLANYYDKELFAKSFQMAKQTNCYSYHLIQALIEADLQSNPKPQNRATHLCNHLPDFKDQLIDRDPSEYNQLIINF